MFKDITSFHEKFDLKPKPYHEQDNRYHNYRVNFMEEELDEYCQAYEQDDQAAMLDAIVDLVYVAVGTAYLYGWNFPEAWRRVHEANMQKIKVTSAADSKRGHSSDIKKPPGWKTPDLSDLV